MHYVAQKFPDAVKSVVTMTGNIAATLLVDSQAREAANAARLDRQGRHSSTPRSASRPGCRSRSRSRTQGAKGLIYTGEPQNLGPAR